MTSSTYLLQKIAAITTVLLAAQPIVNCGFTDIIEPHNIDHVISGIRTPRIDDNTTISSNTKNEKRQAFIPSNYANHFSALANMANFGGFGPMGSMGSLRTVMMGGMLYGLSLIPAVVLALGGNGSPMSSFLQSFGLSKRALPETSNAKMPLLSETQTKRLLQMLQAAFKQWNIADEECKQLFVCQMYRQVSSNGVSPDLELFKEALLHILERGGQRRAGRAAEQLLMEYKHYFVAAQRGMKQDDCESLYSDCELSLYPPNEGWNEIKSLKNQDAKNVADGVKKVDGTKNVAADVKKKVADDRAKQVEDE